MYFFLSESVLPDQLHPKFLFPFFLKQNGVRFKDENVIRIQTSKKRHNINNSL